MSICEDQQCIECGERLRTYYVTDTSGEVCYSFCYCPGCNPLIEVKLSRPPHLAINIANIASITDTAHVWRTVDTAKYGTIFPHIEAKDRENAGFALSEAEDSFRI